MRVAKDLAAARRSAGLLDGGFNMVVAAVIGDKVVGVASLEAAYADRRAEVDEYLTSAAPDTSFELNVAGDIALDHRDFQRGREAVANVVPFEMIGLGRPLTVILETVYVGSYPDTLRFWPGLDNGDILVTSAHKPFQNIEAAPRAVHALVERAPRRKHLEQSAAERGSRLIYYTAAVTDASTLFTVEISVDREFSSELAESLGKAVSAAGALPVFAPAAPYLIAAGVAIPIANKAANLLASPRPYYAETVNVNFGLAGIEAAQARALVLHPGDDDAQFAGYTLGSDNLLRDAEGHAYEGDLPYVVLSLDGTAHADLEGWTAEAASAVLLERFFDPDERLSKALDLTTEALGYFNDVKYQERALKAQKAAAASTGPERERLEKLAMAYIKNIQNETIRKSVEPSGGQ